MTISLILREIPSYKKNQGGNYTESVQLIILIITNIHKHDEGQPCFVTVHHHPMFSSDLEQVCLAARVAQFPLPQFSPWTPPQVPLKKDTYESRDKFFTHRFQSAWWDDSSPLISETKKSKIGKLKRHVKYQKKVSRRLEEHRPFSFSCHIISNTLHCLVKHVKVRLSFLFNVADLSSWKSWEVTKLFTTGHQNIIMSQY